jgi:glycosyltransferase involved in cell wall biosynthesis
MKIAFVCEPEATGAVPGCTNDSIPTRELARNFAADGHQVTVFSHGDHPSHSARGRQRNGVTTEYLGSGAVSPAHPLGDMPAFTEPLCNRWRNDPPDIVHAMNWTSGLAALAASRGLGIPVVQTFPSLGVTERRHSGRAHESPGTATAMRIRLEPAIGRTVSAVLAANSEEASDLARLGVPRKHIKVVPCGVDTDRFAPAGPAVQRNGHPRLVTVTDPGQVRDIDTLLRALARLPQAELVVAGEPPRPKLGTNKHYRGLQRLAHALKVADRVVFMGLADEDELPPLLRSADLYVNTAEYEPTGMIALDAMACGIPVVTTATGAPADAVLDGTTGMLVPPGRPALLAYRIQQLLTRPMLREAYGVAAADRAKSRYSWDRIARETLAVYEAAAA